MDRSNASYSNKMIKAYVEEITKQKKLIKRNFEEMDFENADARNKFKEIVNEMIRNCDSLISKLNSYSFK
ncbi:MAG: hypothetical protein E7213_01855 [Clostridium sp.]|nr:hypothetical protein [Clostridium sp.]